MDVGRLAIDALLLAVLLGGAITDVRRGKIYNALTYTAALAGLVLNGLVEPPAGLGWKEAFLGLLTGFTPLFLVYLAGGLGGGDVKLMGATGAFLGPALTVYALLYTCIAGAAMALGMIVWKEGFQGMLLRLRDAFRFRETEDRRHRLRFPFGVAILVGALWAMSESHLGRTLFDALRGAA